MYHLPEPIHEVITRLGWETSSYPCMCGYPSSPPRAVGAALRIRSASWARGVGGCSAT